MRRCTTRRYVRIEIMKMTFEKKWERLILRRILRDEGTERRHSDQTDEACTHAVYLASSVHVQDWLSIC